MLPRWVTSLAVLIGAYVAVMTGAALWLPHDWDWGAWDLLSATHAPVFDADEIRIVDVPWTTDNLVADRRRITAFLDDLAAHKEIPAAVILDIQFGPCEMQPCEEPMASTRRALATAIAAATVSYPVYALEQPTRDAADNATGLEPHDPEIYAALSGAAHSRFTKGEHSDGHYYRACYEFPVLDSNGNVVAKQRVWDMVERVGMRADVFARAFCDPNDVAVRLPRDPLPESAAVITKLSARGTFPASAQFGNKYVIVGTIEDDHEDAVLPGPELLAWALSDALDQTSGAGAERVYDTDPQGEMLLILVPGFSAFTLSAFIAIFFLLKRTRLRELRRALPWLAAAASACVGLAAFAVFEAWLLESGHIQPQVTLIILGVVLTAVLASLRAFQVLFAEQWSIDRPPAENYDYDVFISYAHEEGAWVFEHVVMPIRAARLSDGRELKVFFDTEEIRYGTSWQDKISLALDGSRFIVPVYSETYFTRPYCNFEIKRAHMNWINAGSESRIVLPIMRGHPKILSTVRDIQATSIDEVPGLVAQIVAEIVERLSRLGEPSPTAGTAGAAAE